MEEEAVTPQESTYGSMFPLLYLLALATTETIAMLDRGCWVLGFC